MLLVALLSLLISFTGITDHPRLLLPQGEEQLVLQAVEADEGIAKVHQGILEQSEAFLTSSPVIYKKEGKRLLFVSREALKRIFYLSYSYRMTGEERYAARAVQEMLQVCSFADWNPSHFLDTAEMALGVAIGYDWLYDYMSEEDRAVVRKGLIDNAYSEATGRFTGFYKNANNWNQVCNAGLLYAALALYEDTPEESQAQIKRCIDSNPVALTCYGPDGAYPEGFNYWGYGTSFQVLLIEALQTALGDDYDLSEAPGYLKSAYFLQMASAPSGKVWNFYDAREQTSCNMMLYWFAAQLGDPSVIYLEQQRLRELPQGFAGESGEDYFAEHRLLPCLPIFARKMDLSRNALPQQKFFVAEGGNTPLFIYRQGWKSREDVYMAVKGGSASTSHAHMDAGSFIYEKDGERWVMDLPMQEYITLESKGLDIWNIRQDSDRWDVFRMGNDS
ncbi:MAG: heparinase, partial [Bacteroidales bacterium]|nr:heparinase [Bacteroidales bacterium]